MEATHVTWIKGGGWKGVLNLPHDKRGWQERKRKEKRKKRGLADKSDRKREKRTRLHCRQQGCEKYAQNMKWCNGYCQRHAGDAPAEEKSKRKTKTKKRLSAEDIEADKETVKPARGRSRKVADVPNEATH